MDYLPKITIVTPSFNSEKYIKIAIESVINQNYPKLEYIIVDGGSEDNTIDIICKYKRIAKQKGVDYKWLSEPDNGQTEAINKGLRMANGEWFAWLNSDDYYESNTMNEICTDLNHDEYSVVYGSCYTIYEYGDKMFRELFSPPKIVNFNTMKSGCVLYGPATFYNTELIRKVGGFDVLLKYWMDYDMLLKLVKVAPFHFVPKALSNFRIHKNQKSPSTLKDWQKYKDFNREAFEVWRSNGGNALFTTLYFRRYVLYGFLVRFFRLLFNNPHYLNLSRMQEIN